MNNIFCHYLLAFAIDMPRCHWYYWYYYYIDDWCFLHYYTLRYWYIIHAFDYIDTLLLLHFSAIFSPDYIAIIIDTLFHWYVLLPLLIDSCHYTLILYAIAITIIDAILAAAIMLSYDSAATLRHAIHYYWFSPIAMLSIARYAIIIIDLMSFDYSY